MQTSNWITIGVALLASGLTLYLSYRKGDLKKLKIHFSPSKFTEGIESEFFYEKGKKIPVYGVISFFSIKSSDFKRICFYIYLTIENRSNHAIEDLILTLQYPMKYYDTKDRNFFKPVNENQPYSNLNILHVDKDNLQVTYKIETIHPNAIVQIQHPISILYSDFNEKITPDNRFFFDVKGTGFSFEPIFYIISAKNLKNPQKGVFWIINVLNIKYTHFFNREKKFFDSLSKEHLHVRTIFEVQIPGELRLGKFKKDALVVTTEKVNISYSHYPHLKEPNSNMFNFEKTDF